MKQRRWSFTVQDVRGRRHRGAVTWSDAPESPMLPPAPPLSFRIALLAAASGVSPPERTAICTPRARRLHAVGDDALVLPRRIDELTLPPHLMADYAGGRIAMSAGFIDPADVFPARSDRPRLDRLALAIVEAAEAEAIAPYTAMIRHSLGLAPHAEVLAELESRLRPGDAAERPPSRVPGVMRLERALKRLRAGKAPADALEQFADDLRFLRLFEPGPVLAQDALRRLADDVLGAPRRKAKVVPLSRKGRDA